MLSAGTQGGVSYFCLWTMKYFCNIFNLHGRMHTLTHALSAMADTFEYTSKTTLGKVCQADWFSSANGARLCLLNSWPWKSHKPQIAATSTVPNGKQRLPGQPKRGGSKSLGGLLFLFLLSVVQSLPLALIPCRFIKSFWISHVICGHALLFIHKSFLMGLWMLLILWVSQAL